MKVILRNNALDADATLPVALLPGEMILYKDSILIGSVGDYAGGVTDTGSLARSDIYYFYITKQDGIFSYSKNEFGSLANYETLSRAISSGKIPVAIYTEGNKSYLYQYISSEDDKAVFRHLSSETSKVSYLTMTDDSIAESATQLIDEETLNEELEKLGVSVREPNDMETPHLYWNGALPATKAEGAVQGTLTYSSSTEKWTKYATLKVQGDSSANYSKKNYTVTIYKDANCVEKDKYDFKGWGERSSWVIKAHFIDHSHIRNISCAKLWGQAVESREDFDTLPQQIKDAPGHGATQGFSLRFWVNGQYWGLYEMIILKKEIFGQKKTVSTHSLLNSDWNNKRVCTFDTAAPNLPDGWTEELQDEIPAMTTESFGNLIKFVASASDDDFVENIGNYVDVTSVIDYDIFARVFLLVDNMAKNQIFATFDGQFWYEGLWDADATLGCPPITGQTWLTAMTKFQDEYYAFKNYGLENMLYSRIERLFSERFKDRYSQLRASVLDINNIIDVYEKNNDRVSPWLAEDCLSTTANGNATSVPYQDVNNIQQIRGILYNRLMYCDSEVSNIGAVSDTYTMLYAVKQIGKSQVNTGIIATNKTTTKYNVSFGPTTFTEYSWGPQLLGAAAASANPGDNMFFPMFRSRGWTNGHIEMFARYGNLEYTKEYDSYLIDTPYVIEATLDKIIINDEEVCTVDRTAEVNPPEELVFLGISNNTTAGLKARDITINESGFQIWEDGVLVRDYRPAKKDRTGQIGLLELVTNTFTVGTNGFTEVERPEEETEKANIQVQSFNESMGEVTGTGDYTVGTTATITATPKSGYKFTQWNDGNTSATRTVTVAEDAIYTAYFAETSVVYILNTDTIEGKTLVVNGESITDTVDITDENEKLINWINSIVQ